MLLFVDSFDHYLTADYPQKWTDAGGFLPTIVAGAGRCGSQAMKVTVFNELSKGILFASTTAGLGFAIKLDTALGDSLSLCALGTGFSDHVLLVRTSDGALHVSRRDGAAFVLLGSSAPDVLRDDDYYFLEFKALIDNGAGTVEVRVNGVSVLALTAQNTFGSAAVLATPTRITFYGNANQNYFVDDLYVFNDAAGEVDDFVGPVRVEWLKPDGNGAHVADFSLVGAATQSQAVRDASGPDGDTSYIQSATLNHLHTSTIQDTSLPAGLLFGVQVNLIARVTDAGYRGLKPVLRQGGTDYLGTEQAPGTSYRDLHEVFEHDPATAAAWLIAGVNSVEAGVKVSL